MPQANYRYLASYTLATVIYDLTVEFCRRFIHSLRQKEQMEQAARSCKSNIAEGSSFSSMEGYLKLLGTARGSVEELGNDFADYLRQNNLEIWDKNDFRIRKFREFRAIWLRPNIPNTPKFPNFPVEAANMFLTFCQMESYLLDHQMKALREKFVQEGGFREKLFRERSNFRSQNPKIF